MTDSDGGDSPIEKPPEYPCVLPGDGEEDDGGLRPANPLFFSTLPEHVAEAKALCATCPVRESCLEYALERSYLCVLGTGVWGGASEAERIEIRRRRASS